MIFEICIFALLAALLVVACYIVRNLAVLMDSINVILGELITLARARANMQGTVSTIFEKLNDSYNALISLSGGFSALADRISELASQNQSGVDPDEPQMTEEQEKAEQMMLDGINNIFSYDIGVALGGEGK